MKLDKLMIMDKTDLQSLAYFHFEIKQRIVGRNDDQFTPGPSIPCASPDARLQGATATVVSFHGRGDCCRNTVHRVRI